MNLITTVLIMTFVMLGSFTATSVAQNSKKVFSVKKSSDYKVEETNRTQSNIVFNLKFIAKNSGNDATDRRFCQILFQFNAQNHNLSQEEINEFSESETRKNQIKTAVGNFAKISNFNIVSLQEYKGHELVLELEQNASSENLKGVIVMIETPKGRMTQTCMNLKSKYNSDDLNDFRSVTHNIIMPE